MTSRLSQRASEFVRAGSKRLSLEGRAELKQRQHYHPRTDAMSPPSVQNLVGRFWRKFGRGASPRPQTSGPGSPSLSGTHTYSIRRVVEVGSSLCASVTGDPIRPLFLSLFLGIYRPPLLLPLFPSFGPARNLCMNVVRSHCAAPGANLLQLARPHSVVASDSFLPRRSRAGPGRGRAPSSFLRPIPPQSRSVRPTMQQEAGLPQRRCER